MPDKKILEQIIHAIRQVLEPDKIILYGSRARGDAREDSDYDILVIAKTFINELKTEQNIYQKLYKLNASVDIIVKTPETVEKCKKRFVSVTKETLNEGITIYE